MPGAADSLARELFGTSRRETVGDVLADIPARLGSAEIRTCRPVLAHRIGRQRLADANSAARPPTEPAPEVHAEVVDALRGRRGQRRSVPDASRA